MLWCPRVATNGFIVERREVALRCAVARGLRGFLAGVKSRQVARITCTLGRDLRHGGVVMATFRRRDKNRRVETCVDGMRRPRSFPTEAEAEAADFAMWQEIELSGWARSAHTLREASLGDWLCADRALSELAGANIADWRDGLLATVSPAAAPILCPR